MSAFAQGKPFLRIVTLAQMESYINKRISGFASIKGNVLLHTFLGIAEIPCTLLKTPTIVKQGGNSQGWKLAAYQSSPITNRLTHSTSNHIGNSRVNARVIMT